MSYTKLFLFIWTVAVFVTQCSAIYCYVCSSMSIEGCGDDFTISTSDNKLRNWCDGSCIKRRGTRVDGAVRRVEIIRGCIKRRATEDCYSDYFNNLDMKACTCNSNLCNGSPLVLQGKSFVHFISILLGLKFLFNSL